MKKIIFSLLFFPIFVSALKINLTDGSNKEEIMDNFCNTLDESVLVADTVTSKKCLFITQDEYSSTFASSESFIQGYYAFFASDGSKIIGKLESSNSKAGIRPMVYIRTSSDISGSGSASDPYVLR